VSALILGTAQFGQVYGVTNPRSAVAESEVLQILREASDSGVKVFDTAIDYGNSHQLLGKAVGDKILERPRIVSKIKFPPHKDLNDWALAEIETATRDLNVKQIDGLLLHQSSDFSRPEVWEALRVLKGQGLVERIGISVYHPDGLQICARPECIELLQLPLNILDDRWEETKWRSRLNETWPPEIHVRSIFLQGLLLADPSQWPPAARTAATEVGNYLRQVCELTGDSALGVCVRFVRSVSWVDGVVVGVYSQAQFKEVSDAFNAPPFSPQQLAQIRDLRPHIPSSLLDPRQWT
jgi:aryl-alcohol dehydrogenase-like predicted oxidoreductase